MYIFGGGHYTTHWGSQVVPGGKELACQCRRRKRCVFHPWVGKIHQKRDRLPTPVFLGFPGGSDSKQSACNVGDLGLIPGLGRSPGKGNSYPLQYCGLENSMDRGTWWATVHGVTKSQTQLSDFHFHTIRKFFKK